MAPLHLHSRQAMKIASIRFERDDGGSLRRAGSEKCLGGAAGGASAGGWNLGMGPRGGTPETVWRRDAKSGV